MKDLLIYIVKSIVEDTDAVNVEEIVNETAFVYKITVAPDDIGRVIGKQGRIAQSIRSIAKAATPLGQKKTIVDIM